MIKEVIFDIDNTLYDYEKGHERGLLNLGRYTEENFSISGEQLRADYQRHSRLMIERLGMDNATIHSRSIRLQNMLEEWGQPLFPHINNMYRAYWEAYFEPVDLEPGILACMQELKELGICMGIGTDMTARMQYEKLERMGFAPYISHMVTSQEAGVEKPHPAFTALCVEKSGVRPEECLFVGDNIRKDVLGAVQGGLRAVWYNRKGKSKPENLELPEESYHEIRHYDELVPYIRTLR